MISTMTVQAVQVVAQPSFILNHLGSIVTALAGTHVLSALAGHNFGPTVMHKIGVFFIGREERLLHRMNLPDEQIDALELAQAKTMRAGADDLEALVQGRQKARQAALDAAAAPQPDPQPEPAPDAAPAAPEAPAGDQPAPVAPEQP